MLCNIPEYCQTKLISFIELSIFLLDKKYFHDMIYIILKEVTRFGW
jgi:hypothetical protein